MAAFKNIPEEWQRLDWEIFQNGWTNLYWKEDVLKVDLEWFKKEKFKIVNFDCSKWTDLYKMHKDLRTKLNFPDYYGDNLDALNDCLSDLEIDDAGFVIVLRHLDVLDKKIAHCLLDILANNSRLHILFGKKLLTLVQVNNPNYQIDNVGSSVVSWNRKEWLESQRRL